MAGYKSQSSTNTNGLSYEALLTCKTNIGGLFFDGFMKVSHESTLTVTEHPVESGASIVDNSYVNPRTIEMQIMMSDALSSYVEGQFVEKYTRSVSAWDALVKIQEQRIPVSVHTRLATYKNMIIVSLRAEDTSETYNGLNATVSLREIPVARLRTVKISEVPQTTDITSMSTITATNLTQDENNSILYNLMKYVSG
jgi:hypothetical protein